MTKIVKLRQYVESICDFSTQYGSEGSISYTALNLIGDHRRLQYHDSSQAYLTRTYGPWCSFAPSAPYTFKETTHHLYPSQDYVELKFKVAVVPSAIEIVEYCSYRSVSKIFACDYRTQKWHLLWQQNLPFPAVVGDSIIFSPPLKKIKFSTDLLRIEFHHYHLDYYAEIYSVCLVGLFEEKLELEEDDPSAPKVYPNLVLNNNSDNQLVGLNALSSLDNSPVISLGRLSLFQEFDYINKTRDSYFGNLPEEIVYIIVKNLDLLSICRVSRCCRSLRDQCYDSLLYTEVDLQPYWNSISDHSLIGLRDRCRNIHHLNLSWCGRNGVITSLGINQFFGVCGKNLTVLYLSCCSFVNEEVLELISLYCPKLQDLDVSKCDIGQNGMRHVSNLCNLKRINLNNTSIDVTSLAILLDGCCELQFLHLGNCLEIKNYDDAAYIICQKCRHMKSLEFWRAKTLTAVGVGHISNLPELEELDISWCYEVSPITGCLRELVSSCTSLKKLFLSAIRYL
ncbi:F-box and leucine-rich repeat protein 4 [Chamberlinius hualienensis]